MAFLDIFSRIAHGVNPWTALTTSTPKQAERGSSSNYGQTVAVPGINSPAQAQPTAPVSSVRVGGGAQAGPDLGSYRAEAQGRISALQNLYNQIFGDIDQSVADRRSQIDRSYDQQAQDLNDSFAKTSAQLPTSYANRNLSSSSYYDTAVEDANKTYNRSLDELNQGREQNYAQLGQFAATQKAQLGAGRDQLSKIDLSSYTDPQALISLKNQIDSQLSQLQTTRAGLQTTPQYVNQLNAIAPTTTQGAAQLQKQLQTLLQSGASPLAKNQIAAGLIRSSGQDPNYWNQYWSNLSQSTATGAA